MSSNQIIFVIAKVNYEYSKQTLANFNYSHLIFYTMKISKLSKKSFKHDLLAAAGCCNCCCCWGAEEAVVAK